MTENFSNVIKGTNLQINNGLNSKHDKLKKSIPKHIIIKVLKSKDKIKNIESRLRKQDFKTASLEIL